MADGFYIDLEMKNCLNSCSFKYPFYPISNFFSIYCNLCTYRNKEPFQHYPDNFFSYYSPMPWL